MKIFLDDIRNPPTDDWTVFRTAEDLISFLTEVMPVGDVVEEISLDHDLGEGVMTGYDFLNWLEQEVFEKGEPVVERLSIHSANPVGRQNMQKAINSIARL